MATMWIARVVACFLALVQCIRSEATTLPQCKVGATVAAKWGGNNAFYEAKITKLDSTTQTVHVQWADGDTTHRVVKPEDVRGCRISFRDPRSRGSSSTSTSTTTTRTTPTRQSQDQGQSRDAAAPQGIAGQTTPRRGSATARSNGVNDEARQSNDNTKPTSSRVGNAKVCSPGMTVQARYRGDHQFYDARISSINEDSLIVVVNWSDGDTKFRHLPLDQKWFRGCVVPDVPASAQQKKTASTTSAKRSGAQADNSNTEKASRSRKSSGTTNKPKKGKRETQKVSEYFSDPTELKVVDGRDARVFIQYDLRAGKTTTCKSKYHLWSLEWPEVSGLEECAMTCAQDTGCNFIFWQNNNPERLLGHLCMGFSSCFDIAHTPNRRYDAVSSEGKTFLVTSQSTVPGSSYNQHASAVPKRPNYKILGISPCSFQCSTKHIGNGVCDWQPEGPLPDSATFSNGPNCNCRLTDWDGGDCCAATCKGKTCGNVPLHCLDPSQPMFRARFKTAHGYDYDETCSGVGDGECPRHWQGDGFCDGPCFTADCGWDGGDCDRGVDQAVVAESRDAGGKLPVPELLVDTMKAAGHNGALQEVLASRTDSISRSQSLLPRYSSRAQAHCVTEL
mgnify:FL=1